MDGTHLTQTTKDRRRVFEEGLTCLSSKLFWHALRLTKHQIDAEELLQETMIKALDSWEQFQPGTNQLAWARMVMRNKFLSDKRRHWRMTPLDQEWAERTLEDSTRGQEALMVMNQDFLRMIPALQVIGKDMADAVIGVHYLGLSYNESAEVLNCAVGTVKSRVCRGLEAIRDRMDPDSVTHVDLSSWEHAAKRVPLWSEYRVIAVAYEQLFKAYALASKASISRKKRRKH